MRRSERIVDALRALGETGQASALSHCSYPAPAAGQNLVRICLMPDVPDELVRRRVEDIVERYGKFDYTQAGTKMSACDRDGINSFLAQFVSNLPQLSSRKGAKRMGLVDPIEQRRLG